MKKVEDIKIDEETNINEIIKEMELSGGFTAKKFALAIRIIKEMVNDKETLKFLSFPACIIATGNRGIIKEMVKRKWFNVIVTTCGTLDHDVARSFKNYYHGSFRMNDVKLHKKGINRIGNILVPNDSYGIIIEERMSKWLKEIYNEKKEISTYELCWEIGKRLKEDSILYWSWKNNIPIIVPGITDGAIGYQLWQFYQMHRDFKVNILEDEQFLSDLVWNAKKLGGLIIGGGISKHHVIWWSQFKNGLDYAVYITTAQEYDGSLSGARTYEAISWGKIKESAKHITVEGDATLYLPIIYATLLREIEK
ncbi:MAG: deoxyhypusine synthase [Nitrososphaerota archaeon]